ncbi:hypothetical protein MLD38_005378 [Melastoma candidum]|uniref:Uncharacterized protein n=1 Tax=Melastoma candidum TaxID=119954 RepID=A0ACB9S7U7_9MYRT|nr:hypothetical protein MLD38_005378 [Melastoma candidum]
MLALILGVNLQCLLDLVVAGISLAIGLGFFSFVATILCAAAFLLNSKKEQLIDHALTGIGVFMDLFLAISGPSSSEGLVHAVIVSIACL